ncbi:hypothetical protein [Stomatohabitans albus]|uniref:hypothetical protein n=1 Tax=Stomatohabitans albus TaxID=3110766 RepID=UPI00300D535D
MATVQRFEGPSLDDVLAQVRRALGDDAEIIEANRIKATGRFGGDRYEVKARRAKKGQRRPDRQAAESHINPQGTSKSEPYPGGLDDATVQAAMDHVQQVMADLERKRIVERNADAPGPTRLVDLADQVSDSLPQQAADTLDNPKHDDANPGFAQLLADARSQARANTPAPQVDWPELEAYLSSEDPVAQAKADAESHAGTVEWEPLDWSAKRVRQATPDPQIVDLDSVEEILSEDPQDGAESDLADEIIVDSADTPVVEPDDQLASAHSAFDSPDEPVEAVVDQVHQRDASPDLTQDAGQVDEPATLDAQPLQPIPSAQAKDDVFNDIASSSAAATPPSTDVQAVHEAIAPALLFSHGSEGSAEEPLHDETLPHDDDAVEDDAPTQAGWVDANRPFMGLWTDEADGEESGWFETESEEQSGDGYATLRNHRLVEWLSRNDLTPEALHRALEGLPQPEHIPPGPGLIIAVVGEGPLVLPLARRMATELGADPVKTVLASEHRSHASVPDNCRISNGDEAALDRRAWRRRSEATLVAVDTSTSLATNAQDWAYGILEALQPHQVIALVDAARKTEDVARWIADLGGVDSIALTGLEETVSPHAILELGIPVARLGTRQASPAAWTDLLRNRREPVQ